MPPITGASLAPLALIPDSQSIQPLRASRGLGFKAAAGGGKRISPWQPRARLHEPFTLVRGEYGSRLNKAARCRERLAGVASHLRTTAAGAPARDDLAKLERDEKKLRGQTRVHASLRDIVIGQAIRKYLPEIDGRKAKQRGKALIKLRQGVGDAARVNEPALREVRRALDYETALEASARQVKALGREYVGQDGRIKLSAEIIHDLISLSDGMKMLRPHDQDRADFLYPAMKLMHEASRGTATGTATPPLVNLLGDLAGAGSADPSSLRAQLTRSGGGLDIWLANNAPPSYQQAPDATRQGMADDMNALLDGLAGAARQVLREEFLAQVPGWARDAQPGLFQEARTLYTSAQRWRDGASQRGTDDAILQAAPADTVNMLLEQAANHALGTPAAPAGNQAPLLGGLTARLSRVAECIDRSLAEGGIAAHTPADEIATLRQELMHQVLEETGMLGEIHRLRESASGPAAGAPPPLRPDVRDAADTGLALRVFGPDTERPHPMAAKRIKHAAANAQRQIANVLSACLQAGAKPLAASKLDALNEARAALDAVHGRSAQDIWQGVVDGMTRRLKDRDLQSLNTGPLRVHVNGARHLTAKLTDPALRAGSDKLLGDIWASACGASARSNTGSFLKSWRATLATPAGMADSGAISRQIDHLSTRISFLDDGNVGTARLLSAALDGLSDAELGVLIGALASAPTPGLDTQPDAPPMDAATPTHTGTLTLRQRLARYLKGDTRSLDRAGRIPARQGKIAHDFQHHLCQAARAQAEKRMDTLRDSLVPDFRTALFAHARVFHGMLDTPAARAANGPVADTIEGVVLDAVKGGRLTHEHGEKEAAALMDTRFLRTANGYDVVGDMTRTLCRDTAALHARLDAGMKELGLHSYWPGSAAQAWRNNSVDCILRETGIWERLDNQLARRLPRDIDRHVDAPRWSAFGRPAAWADGYEISKQSPADHGHGMSQPSVYSDRRPAPGSFLDEEGYTIIPEPPVESETSVAAIEQAPHLGNVPAANGGHRISQAISDDSGFDDESRSAFSSDDHPYEAPRTPPLHTDSPPYARSSQSRPASIASTTSTVDTRLAAALQAALEQRNRGLWNTV
jgi:hypothetical protein